MGRKKKRGICDKATALGAVAKNAEGDRHQNEELATKCDPSGTSVYIEKQRHMEYNRFDSDHSINDCDPRSSMRFGWFSGVNWVRRQDDELHETLEKEGASLLMPADTSAKSSTNHPSREIESQSPVKKSIPIPMNTHSSLLSELNQLKQKLMPAAKMRADAINKSQGTNITTPSHEFRQARSICNPYECLGETFSKTRSNRSKKKCKKQNYYEQHSSSGLSQFVNRSAIKLANIDSILGFSITSAHKVYNEQPNFVFVDLCGGPGGFSEYILYRHVNTPTLPDKDNHQCNNPKQNDWEKFSAHELKPCFGFGMSLSGSNDDGKGVPWDLDHLKQYHLHCNAARGARKGSTRENLCYHVCNGADDTGSIYNWDNVIRLQHDILTTVHGKGGITRSHGPIANLVVADGGFDAQRDSDNQESMAHRIIVSQTAAALTLLRPGGVFVLKMFGFRKEGTRRMLRYVYEYFDKMTFVKPILSRPASAERYLVCCGYSGHKKGWDGFTWREQMITQLETSHEEKTNSQKYAPLDELMESFDLEMLQLNVDTCTSIINYLSNESKHQSDGASVDPKQKRSLDLKAYETAWQLF